MPTTRSADNDNSAVDVDVWADLPLHKLPKTKAAALDAGVRFFYTGEECRHGHLAPKYARGGRCVTCTRMQSARQQNQCYKGNSATAKAAVTRALAIMTGSRVYVPTRPCAKGHYLRIVGSNNCVDCQKESHERRRTHAKEVRLIKIYGLDFAARDKLVDAQGYKCAICIEPFNDNRKMHVDHCHHRGKVRGILCALCNQAIGLLKDNPTVIRRAAEYVENAA